MPYCISNSFAQSLLSKVNNSWIARWCVPFWLPKSIKWIGEIWFIVTYWIVRTSYKNSNIYVSTSWLITNSSTNHFTYLGKSNKYWDILYNWLTVTIVPVNTYTQTTKTVTVIAENANWANSQKEESYTCPYDWYIYGSFWEWPGWESWYRYSEVYINWVSIWQRSSNTTTKFTWVFVKKGSVIKAYAYHAFTATFTYNSINV